MTNVCVLIHVWVVYMFSHLADLSMTVAEVKLLDAIVDLLLSHHGQGLAVGRVETAVHERRIVVVESAYNITHSFSKNVYYNSLLKLII